MLQADVGIIGAGPSGLAAAIAAGRDGESVILLEKMGQVGKRLLSTGNGRCNLMNLHPSPYTGDSAFAEAVMGSDPVAELTAFWDSLGLYLRYDSEGRGYPCTFMAATVMEVLKAELKRLNVEIRTGAAVQHLEKVQHDFLLRHENGTSISTGRVIVATGGTAQPKLGGNDSAWSWLKQMGHEMIPARPALVPLRTDARSIGGLAGMRVKCQISLERDGKPLHEERGELLFTERGISGICVMQCSRFLPPDGKALCRVNLVPDLFPDRRAVYEELIRRQQAMPEAEPVSLLLGLCASKIGYAVCKQAGLALRGEKAAELSAAQIESMAGALTGYRIQVSGPEGMDRAQVMSGGVDCVCIRPDNMESLLCSGLHITGELLNVDGDCGGYNLMFAFLSGLRAGKNRRQAE